MTLTLHPVPAVGTVAPDFTLASTAGREITLSDFRGDKHVLVAFFPMAFTSVCTAEMCAFTEDFDQFASQDVVVLPVSIDAVPSLLEFKNKHKLAVDLLSDMRREVSAAYGVLLMDKWFSTRAYFLIDKQGVVRWAHVEETPGQRRENSEIAARIAELG
jgi:mycoredoxin-dependent peroxiredoxin